MPILDELGKLIDSVEAADTQLDELAAVNNLYVAVDTLRRNLLLTALVNHSGAEVGQALGGISKQAVSALARRITRRAERADA